MPESCEKFRVMLSIEHHKLLAWAKAAGLIETEKRQKISVSLGANPVELMDVVDRIKIILNDFIEYNARYTELHPERSTTAQQQEAARTVAQSRDFAEEVTSLTISYEKTKEKGRGFHSRWHDGVQAVRNSFKNPLKRVRWVMKDEAEYEGLLKDLNFYTERLRQMMDDYHSHEMLSSVNKSYLEIVQTRKLTQEVKRLFEASRVLLDYSSQPSAQSSSGWQQDTLRDLARLRYLNVPAEELDTSELENMYTDFERLTIQPYQVGSQKPMADLTVGGSTKVVWIEWKPYKEEWLSDEDERMQIHPATVKRTAAMAKMLGLPKPKQFSTPNCIGFFDDRKRKISSENGIDQFGWIFEVPASTKSLASLFDILSDADRPRPSLNTRIALASDLASSVLYMHAVNWLHKAIRSSNVVIPVDENGNLDYSRRILSGFEYSRPDSSDHTTESGPPSVTTDMYRWPSVQGDHPRDGANRSRKTYDVYSLGLLLLEIAYWEPLHRILKMVDYPNIGWDKAEDVRETLLETEASLLAQLKMSVGEKYHGVVKKCIVAHGQDAFGVEEDEDQEGGAIGWKLQEAFMDGVVNELQAIKL